MTNLEAQKELANVVEIVPEMKYMMNSISENIKEYWYVPEICRAVLGTTSNPQLVEEFVSELIADTVTYEMDGLCRRTIIKRLDLKLQEMIKSYLDKVDCNLSYGDADKAGERFMFESDIDSKLLEDYINQHLRNLGPVISDLLKARFSFYGAKGESVSDVCKSYGGYIKPRYKIRKALKELAENDEVKELVIFLD